MPIDRNTRGSILSYFTEQLLFAGRVPNDKFLLIEKTTDERKERDLFVFHSLFGRRVDDVLSRAFAIELGKAMGAEAAIMVNDNGFVLATDAEEGIDKMDIEEIVSSVSKSDISRAIKSNVRRTEMMKRRFRHAAVRSLMVLRNYKGKKISVKRQQINSELLLKAAEEISPDFPIIKEAYREIMEDVMDLSRAKDVLAGEGRRDKIRGNRDQGTVALLARDGDFRRGGCHNDEGQEEAPARAAQARHGADREEACSLKLVFKK